MAAGALSGLHGQAASPSKCVRGWMLSVPDWEAGLHAPENSRVAGKPEPRTWYTAVAVSCWLAALPGCAVAGLWPARHLGHDQVSDTGALHWQLVAAVFCGLAPRPDTPYASGCLKSGMTQTNLWASILLQPLALLSFHLPCILLLDPGRQPMYPCRTLQLPLW